MPADEHWEFAITIPAGTLKTAPLRVPLATPLRRTVGFSWSIPQGPSGTLGWRFTMHLIQIIPVNAGSWLIRDGSASATELQNLPDSGDWSVQAYNTGTFPHTIYITWYAEVIRPKAILVTPFGLNQLQPATDARPAHSGGRNML